MHYVIDDVVFWICRAVGAEQLMHVRFVVAVQYFGVVVVY